MSRLTRYRELLSRLEPTGPNAFGGLPGIHVPSTTELERKLATALALRPSGSHLVAGVIGSGKTTTVGNVVRTLKEQFKETGDHAEYIDVSVRHQLDVEPLTGVLIALVGNEFVRRLAVGHSQEESEAALSLKKHAEGFEELVSVADQWAAHWEDEDGFPLERIVSPGALRPQTILPHAHLLEPLRVLRDAAGKKFVFVFDSLDRLLDSDRFREATEHDLPILKAAGIGVVVVGPARFGLASDRTVAKLFDVIHIVQTANPESPEGLAFLSQVLRNRASIDVLPGDAVHGIAANSGGILRDLLSLANHAAIDAYDRGKDAIDSADVRSATYTLGESKAVGLDAASLAILRSILSGVPFKLNDNLGMVERGQVVQTSVGKWKVHPALRSFLEEVAEAA